MITPVAITRDNEAGTADPAYADAGAGALRRMSGRTLEQAWLAATMPRQAMALARGTEAAGLLDGALPQPEPTPLPVTPVSTVAEIVPVPMVTIAPVEPLVQAASTDSWALPVHPALVSFWLGLVLMLLALLMRCIHWRAPRTLQPRRIRF